MKESKVIEFLNNNSPSPFTKKTKLVIYKSNNQDEEIINNLIKDIYNGVIITKISNYNVCFISGKYDVLIKDLFITISDDIGYEICVHDGIYINQDLSSDDITKYVNIYDRCKKAPYMDIADMQLNSTKEDYFTLLDIIKRSNFTYIYKDIQTIDIIEALFKNNLNVLQTSKVLYLHRNSILNKIDTIYKETGLHLQRFTNAFLIMQIINER